MGTQRQGRLSSARGGQLRQEGPGPLAAVSASRRSQRVQQRWTLSAPHRRHQQQRGTL